MNFVNNNEKLVGGNDSKRINECSYHISPEEDFGGNCKLNKYFICSSYLKKSYKKCPIYKLNK